MLIPKDPRDIPTETAKVARAAFPNGNKYMRLRDELGPIYNDDQFSSLFVWRGRPAESPGFMAQVTIMQFAEGLTDRQAAEAVRGRIDWKYALGLELTDTGFAHSALSDFRSRLVSGDAVDDLLNIMLDLLKERGWVKSKGKQRTDSTHVVAAMRDLSRLESNGETMRQVLNDLASVAPDWLVDVVDPEWYGFYGPRFEEYRLPQEQKEREAMHLKIGQNGMYLLEMIYEPSAPEWLSQLPSVQLLRQIWIQQFYIDREGQLYIRMGKRINQPPNHLLIVSPYDPEARMRIKRGMKWSGYSAHFTESCDENLPLILTNVITTPATTSDKKVTPQVHRDLEKKGLLPSEHFVDTAYNDADLIVESREKEIEMVAPVQLNTTWQAKDENAYDISHFTIDWEKKKLTCPKGWDSINWMETKSRYGQNLIAAYFSLTCCMACDARVLCTRSKNSPRQISFHQKAQFLALEAARKYQKTEAFKKRYHQRAGIEGAISQAVRAFDFRRSRYIGRAKNHLQNVATAAAMNLTRLAAWLDDVPRAKTRQSRFAALAPMA